MSANENVCYVSGGHRSLLRGETLLLGMTGRQASILPVPLLFSARLDKRKNLEGLFAPRIFREYSRLLFHYPDYGRVAP
jgi:hypothetical protein